MYKSFVLKHVAEPPKLLFASFQATIISMGVWVLSAMVMKLLLGLSFMGVFLASIVTFLLFHGWMIFLSHKDPYFFNVLMARLKCRKTKNLIPTKDNFYGA